MFYVQPQRGDYYPALHYTSTSNGECQTLLGLYPRNGGTATMTRTGEVSFQENGQTVRSWPAT